MPAVMAGNRLQVVKHGTWVKNTFHGNLLLSCIDTIPLMVRLEICLYLTKICKILFSLGFDKKAQGLI